MLILRAPGDFVRRKPSLRPLIALAVDDDETRVGYAYALIATGFAATKIDQPAPDGDTRGNGMRGGDGHSDATPDVIVVATSADSVHGWAFVDRLKHDLRTRDIPLVALVDDLSASTCDRARLEHCAAVCVKTCPADVFASGVRAVLDREAASIAPPLADC
jgi:CheY-like chemotaxis protein